MPFYDDDLLDDRDIPDEPTFTTERCKVVTDEPIEFHLSTSQRTYNYGYDEYQNDIRNLLKMIRQETKNEYHVIGIERGGLVPATHMSNLLSCQMSVIRFQTRHGIVDKETRWYGKPAVITANDRFIIMEDIYDSGKTIKQIQKDLDDAGLGREQVSYYTLFGNSKAKDDGVIYLHESLDRWIVFPWERV